MSFSGGSLISRIGARARANENHWAKKEQELELQKQQLMDQQQKGEVSKDEEWKKKFEKVEQQRREMDEAHQKNKQLLQEQQQRMRIKINGSLRQNHGESWC